MAFTIKAYEDINRLKAKVKKQNRERKIIELSKGTYQSADDLLAKANEEMAGFFFRIGGERIWQFEANQQLIDYKPMIFNRNDTRLAFSQMFVTLKAFHRSLRLFEVAEKNGKTMFFKVYHLLDTEGYSLFQRIREEDAMILISQNN